MSGGERLNFLINTVGQNATNDWAGIYASAGGNLPGIEIFNWHFMGIFFNFTSIHWVKSVLKSIVFRSLRFPHFEKFDQSFRGISLALIHRGGLIVRGGKEEVLHFGF